MGQNSKRQIRVTFTTPEPNEERDAKAIKQLAEYIAKKIQSGKFYSSTAN